MQAGQMRRAEAAGGGLLLSWLPRQLLSAEGRRRARSHGEPGWTTCLSQRLLSFILASIIQPLSSSSVSSTILDILSPSSGGEKRKQQLPSLPLII